MHSKRVGMAAALALLLSPSVGMAAAATSLGALIVGTWDMTDLAGLADPCGGALSSTFGPRGSYRDPDSSGTWAVRGAVLTVRTRDGRGRLGKPVVSRLVRVVSRDRLVMANDDGRFGMKRCGR